tara:strand:- start:3826 stop:4692 length:867 start_codon:yes stop_codon:yes gene_type:complete
MKHYNKFLLVCLVFFGWQLNAQSVRTYERIEPEFTTVDRLIELKSGMTKEEVLNNLGVYPFDILYNQENECEIHIYKYAKTKRRHLSRTDNPGSSQQLDDGEPFYDDMDEVAIYYRDGSLEAFIVESLEKSTYEILNYDALLAEQCNPAAPVMPPPVPEPPVRGCTDPLSLTYNADATEDDGSCEYCECGYVKAEYNTEAEGLICPPCLPSKELWEYWIVMERCDLIQSWIERYPPLFNNVPKGFLENCKPKEPEAESEDCDWCKMLEKSGMEIDLHSIDVKLKKEDQ